MSDLENVKFSLKAMVNKEKSKVLFVEAGGDFVDVLLSFLTMPLGKLIKVLEKHYGVDQSPVIGSITTLYKGLTSLHSDNFWTEGAKQMLLNPVSSFEDECRGLKLDITDSRQLEFFRCAKCSCSVCKGSVVASMYITGAWCKKCLGKKMKMLDINVKSEAVGGVFTQHMAPFIISDGLHVIPEVQELKKTITILGIGDADGAELMNVTFGVDEIMDVLKASLCSPSPLSDVILNQKNVILNQKKRQMIPPAIVKSEDGTTPSNSTSKKMSLKLMVQKSTNKMLYARAGEDFVDFLSSFLIIPLGGTASFFSTGNPFVSINNLYKSIADLTDCKFFKTPDMKNRFASMKLAHGSISENQILPLTEECLSFEWLASITKYGYVNFPKGKGKYVKGLRTYMVADDLTVAPFSVSSTISLLNSLNIPLSDITEMELQIGVQEAFSILLASLSSTCVLTDALKLSPTLGKKRKHENA